MKPVELILSCWDSISKAYSETGSWPKVYDRVQPLKAIRLATVKQYCGIILEVKQELAKTNELDNVIQNELERVKQELDKTKQLYNVKQSEADKVKQELDKQIELNNVIQNELDRVIQERDDVKQELNKVKQLDNRLYTDERLDMVSQDNQEQAGVKQKLNICGWSVQRDRKGYYRAFKRLGGKLKAVYLGKSLDDAEKKIEGMNV